MIAVGIDPGLAKGGFAAVRFAERRKPRLLRSVHYRSPPAEEHHIRLARIRELAAGFVCDHQPEVVVVEEVFANINGRASMHLAAARGAIMSGLLDAGAKRVVNVAPSQMKKAVAGKGNAGKKAVVAAVIELVEDHPALSYPGTGRKPKSLDEFDAIGLALYGGLHR